MAEQAGSWQTYGRSAGAPAPARSWGALGLHAGVKIAILGGLLGFVFRREITQTVHVWLTDPNWSHGFLIPLFSFYFLHQKKAEILGLQYVDDPLVQWLQGRRPPRLLPGQARASYWGLLLLLATLVFYAFNVVSPAGYAYLRPMSLLLATAAVVLFLGGRRLLRCTWLPIAFLVFAVPPPARYYKALATPLQRMAAIVATALLNLVHDVDATCSGVVIDIVYKTQHLAALNVEEACSGMRLLMAFLALGVAMAYLHERPAWQRAVLLLSTVPIAVLCNVVRVTVTGFIYVFAGPAYTRGIYHDALGLAMLPLAFGLYGLLAWFMSSLFIEEGGVVSENIVIRKRGT
jgi:exosortase